MFGLEETTLFYILSLSVGLAYGVVAQRRQFCFSGSIKDFVLFGHTKRGTSLIVAILSAIIFSQGFAYLYEIDLGATRYFSDVNYLFIIIGGAMFGYGMMVADGCCSRHLIKLAQGDRDSLFIILSLATFSYLTYLVFSHYGDAIQHSRMLSFAVASEVMSVSLYLVVPVVLLALYRCSQQCKNILECWDGLLIGAIVSFAWYATFFMSEELFMNVSLQSLSFVYPLGKMVDYVQGSFGEIVLVFSVLTAIGVFVGAFVSSLFNKRYSKKIQCTDSYNPPSLPKKMLAGALMGIGGMMAAGCTVGQGLSGVSTLSFASFLALASIFISAWFSAKKMHKQNALVACFMFDFEKK